MGSSFRHVVGDARALSGGPETPMRFAVSWVMDAHILHPHVVYGVLLEELDVLLGPGLHVRQDLPAFIGEALRQIVSNASEAHEGVGEPGSGDALN